MSPDNFLDLPATYPSYGWLSPRISFGREMNDEDASRTSGLKKPPPPAKILADPPEESDLEVSTTDFGGFEFRLEDPVDMLPADELFSDGKLVPLQLSMIRPAVVSTTPSGIRSPDTPKSRRRAEISGNDPYMFSPKAPRCSSRWKELLGLRKLYQNSHVKHDNQKTTPSGASQNGNGTKSLKHFLHRSSKSSSDASLNLPLLKESENESISVSSRLSLSSSSSGHDHDDLPRLSLDSEKPAKLIGISNSNSNPPRVRLVKPKVVLTDNATRVGRSPIRRPADSAVTTSRGVSVDSPRMNSSGKIIYHSLERSSSSPSSFNGGPRFKHRGMERSYSANVRVTPVLNVPVCSLRGSSKSGGVFGFPLFSSAQKREAVGGGIGSASVNGSNGGMNRSQQSNAKNRTDRT